MNILRFFSVQFVMFSFGFLLFRKIFYVMLLFPVNPFAFPISFRKFVKPMSSPFCIFRQNPFEIWKASTNLTGKFRKHFSPLPLDIRGNIW